jgi:hypothetical protein
MWASSTSTVITKLLAALTGHSGTASISLHPILALRALLKLRPLREFDEGLIILIEAIIDSILFAGHSHVVVASTPQTVVLFTGWAAIIIQCLIKLEYCLTTCSRAPGS